MFSDENKSSSLAKLLNSFDFVIMDTCSLMEDGFPLFMDVLVNAKDYLREDVRITVYHSCLEELKKHSKNKLSDDARIAAKRAIKILKQAKKAKLFEFPKKEKDQNFADNVIYVSVSQMRITKKVLVITQDKKLAEDLGRLNFLDSQKGRKVSIYRVLPNGSLDVNRGERNRYSNDHQRQDKRGGAPQAPVAKPVKKEDTNSLLIQAKSQDDNLWSLLHNPNCPAKRKKADISAQLSLLAKIPEEERKRATFRYSEAQLQEELKKADVPAEPKVPEKKVEPAPAKTPKKEESKPALEKPAETPQIRGFFGNGPTLEAAITDAGRYQGILFRDASVEYIPQIHGDMDLTAQELPAIAKMVREGPAEGITYRERLFVRQEKAIKGIRVSLALLKEPIQKIEPPKPKERLPEKPAEAKKPAPQKKKAAAKPLKEEKPKQEPVEATLIVAVPEDEKKKAAIEQKAKKEASASTKAKKEEPEKKKAAKKPKEEKTEGKNEKASSKKKAPATTKPEKEKAPKKKAVEAKPKKATEAPVEKEEPKAKAPAKKQKKEQPAKPTPKKEEAKPVQPTALEKAQKAEARLLSVLSNGNYPKESKLADLKSQLELVRALKPEEAAELKYNADALKGMIGLMS